MPERWTREPLPLVADLDQDELIRRLALLMVRTGDALLLALIAGSNVPRGEIATPHGVVDQRLVWRLIRRQFRDYGFQHRKVWRLRAAIRETVLRRVELRASAWTRIHGIHAGYADQVLLPAILRSAREPGGWNPFGDFASRPTTETVAWSWLELQILASYMCQLYGPDLSELELVAHPPVLSLAPD